MKTNTIEFTVSEKLAEWNIKFSARLLGETKRDNWTCDEWRVSIGPFETSFYTGTGHRKPIEDAGKNEYRRGTLAHEEWERRNIRPVSPSAASVLYSLIMDSEAINESFSDWCDNNGYSDDSFSALDTYRECCKTAEAMRKIFTSSQREELRELLQDY
jgi:hypothetical protein